MNRKIAEELLAIVSSACDHLRALTESQVSVQPAPGQWSRKQILGHLVDSASNNHQRFVRALESEHLVFPAYAQDHWVRAQGYDRVSWSELVEFWLLYNRHLAGVIARMPLDRLSTQCQIGAQPAVTLGYLVEDYVAHLRHHLHQLLAK